MTERQRQNVARDLARLGEQAAGRDEARRLVREGELAEQERQRQEANEAVAPLLARAEAERQQRELEKERRIRAEEEARRAEGRAELEEHARQQLSLWLVNGGTEESFAAAWPEIEREFMAGKQAERQKTIDQGRVF